MNLAGNALKFTPSGGRIVLGAVGTETEVEFFVRDTGPGIPADKVDAVFEVQAARPGRGVARRLRPGVVDLQKVVELHGGRIWVESRTARAVVSLSASRASRRRDP